MTWGVLALLVAAQPGQRPTALLWDPTAACDKARFVAALSFRTDRVRLVGETEQSAEGWLEVSVTKQGNRLKRRIAVRLPSATTTREVTGHKCQSVIDAMSLSAALLLDPEHAKLGPIPAQLPAVVVPTETKPPEVPLVVVEATPTVVLPPAPPAPTPPTAQLRELPVPPTAQRAAVPENAPPGSASTWLLGAATHMTTAISAVPNFGGSAQVTLERGRLTAHVSLGAGSGLTVNSAAGSARYPFHVMASASLGAGVQFGPLRFDGALKTTLLGFSVTSPSAVRGIEVWRWLPSVGPSLRVAWVTGHWRVGGGVLGGFNLRQDTYVIDPDGGVFTTPLVFVHPELFVSYAI